MTNPQTTLKQLERRIAKIEAWIDFWETVETNWRKKCKKKKR